MPISAPRFIFAALLSALACAPLFAAETPAPKLPANYLPVPLVRQATSYSCGAAVMQSVLYYWNAYDGGEAALYEPLGTKPEYGTDSRGMAKAAAQWGLTAELKEKMEFPDLEKALTEGKTVILDIQAWPDTESTEIDWSKLTEDGHYVVLIGMDEHYLYVMDPSVSASYGYIPRKELLDRWHDYEESEGKVWQNVQLGIVISGKEKPKTAYPAPLVRVL